MALQTKHGTIVVWTSYSGQPTIRDWEVLMIISKRTVWTTFLELCIADLVHQFRIQVWHEIITARMGRITEEVGI